MVFFLDTMEETYNNGPPLAFYQGLPWIWWRKSWKHSIMKTSIRSSLEILPDYGQSSNPRTVLTDSNLDFDEFDPLRAFVGSLSSAICNLQGIWRFAEGLFAISHCQSGVHGRSGYFPLDWLTVPTNPPWDRSFIWWPEHSNLRRLLLIPNGKIGGWLLLLLLLPNIFKRPKGCIGRPGLCPGRSSYIERFTGKETGAMLAPKAMPPRATRQSITRLSLLNLRWKLSPVAFFTITWIAPFSFRNR